MDSEISTIAGPQLVVPVMNARYALNAANARWGSLYNALYGTDVIPETDGASRGNKYNPKRGEKVIEYTRNFLDENVPLFKGSWKDISGIPKVYNGKLSLKLKDEKQFVGYSGTSGELSSLLLKKNNLHIDIIFDPDKDRKSTRLNSSPALSSYAVSCLKKKINKIIALDLTLVK